MINNYKYNVLKKQFLKSYSILQEATKLIVLKGISPYYDFNMKSSENSDLILDNAIYQYSLILKGHVCSSSNKYCRFDPPIKNLIGTSSSNLPIYQKKFLVLDGNFTIFMGSYSPHYIFIDINGIKKGPNRIWIDFHTFKINEKNAIEPIVSKDHDARKCSYTQPNSTDGYYGVGCTEWALKNLNPDGSGEYWKDFLGKIK